MNSNRSQFQNSNYGNPRRHPEQPDNYRFDDYGSAAHGGYGNEGYAGTWGNQGNEGAGSRHVANHDLLGSTYSTSRNQGNMGSYGGAQGFGSARGGYPTQRPSGSGPAGHNFHSGMGHPHEAGRSGYGSEHQRTYQSNSDSHGNNGNYNRDLYGSDNERRFQGAQAQQQYNFREADFAGNQGNYMGSGYNRVSRGEYGSNDGNYGSLGSYDSGRSGSFSGENSGNYNNSGDRYIQNQNRGRTFRNNNDHDRY